MVSSPRVSVIIPTYQCDRYLAQAIESVLAQTGCTFELIVVDDGSTDRTAQIVTTYDVTSIRYLYQDNQGVCAARNNGLAIAQGELIAFLDADDYFLANKLVEQVACFDANPDLGLVQSGWRRVDACGEPLQDVTLWDSIPELTLENWLRFKPVLPSAMMFRRHWLDTVGGFDPTYQVAEDVELVLRLSLAGCSAGWLKQVTVAYRQHATNTMTDGIAQARDVQRVMDQFFAQSNLPYHIQLIEKNVRYNTLVWIACYLYHTGSAEKTIEQLQRAYPYSPYRPIETVMNWTESLVEFCKTQDRRIDVNQLLNSGDWQQLIQWVLSNQTTA